ncbi:MAG: bactofilin family protein [Terriglobales bacterium]
MWNPKPEYPPRNSPETRAETPRPQESSMAARVTALPQQNISVIGKSITINGDVTGSEPLHVEGTVKGAIRLESAYLNIGPEAKVQAVFAREVVVRGSVNGSVNVSERIDIRTGGSVVGDVTAHSVSIEEGAYFKGSIDMRRQEAAKPKVQPPVSSSSPKPVEQPERAAAVSA